MGESQPEDLDVPVLAREAEGSAPWNLCACSQIGNLLTRAMQVIALRTLKQFWALHDQAEVPLRAWYANASAAVWNTPQDIKTEFGPTVDFIKDNRVIFDIGGNGFRLIVHVSYTYKRILVKFIGTHKEYDRINPETV